jgi:L-alanine-DL-glutamate epimerase-like enolase superfamily enzyme
MFYPKNYSAKQQLFPFYSKLRKSPGGPFMIKVPKTGHRIARIEAFPLESKAIKEAWTDEYGWPSTLPSLLIKVTGEDGTYGIGEGLAQHWYLGETLEQMMACVKLYESALRGLDPINIALCHHYMMTVFGTGMPGGRAARGGVDIALYDLAAKLMGLPVHALLGGALRKEFQVLTNLYHKTPDKMAEACTYYAELGYKGLKVKVGDVLHSKGWNRDNFLQEIAKLEAALEATPRDVMIDADANQGWVSAAWTVGALQRFRGHDNLSIEQPLHYDDLTGAAHVRAYAGVPLILDESVWSANAVMRLAKAEACDRIVLKLNRIGGFYEARKIIDISEASGIGVSIDMGPWTIIGSTAACHIAALCQYPYPVDCEGHLSFTTLGQYYPFTGGVTINADGIAHLPDSPGLGVDVDWDILKKHISC